MWHAPLSEQGRHWCTVLILSSKWLLWVIQKWGIKQRKSISSFKKWVAFRKDDLELNVIEWIQWACVGKSSFRKWWACQGLSSFILGNPGERKFPGGPLGNLIAFPISLCQSRVKLEAPIFFHFSLHSLTKRDAKRQVACSSGLSSLFTYCGILQFYFQFILQFFLIHEMGW